VLDAPMLRVSGEFKRLGWKSIATTALFVVVASLTACTTPKPDAALDAVAGQMFDDVRLGRFNAARARMTLEARAVSPDSQLQAIRSYAPPLEPSERRAVGWQISIAAGDSSTAQIAYELRYPEEGMLYTLVLKRADSRSAWAVQSFHLNKASYAELANNTLGSPSKGPMQWAFLATTVLSPLLMLFALIIVLRAPNLKLKWLWAIVAFAGIGVARMNWSTGQWGFNILSVQLIGFSLSRQGFLGFYPWLLKFTPPVGAIAALWRVRHADRSAPRSEAVITEAA